MHIDTMAQHQTAMSAHALHQRMSEEDIRTIIPSPHSDRESQFHASRATNSSSTPATQPRHNHQQQHQQHMQQTPTTNSTPHLAHMHRTAPVENSPAYFSSSRHHPTVDPSEAEFDDTRRMSDSGGMQERTYFQQTPQQQHQVRSSTPSSTYSIVSSASRLQSPSATTAASTPMPSVTALFDNYRAKQAALDRTHGAPIRAGNIHASTSVTTTSSLTQRIYSSQSTRNSPSARDSNSNSNANPFAKSHNQSSNASQRRPSSAAPATRQQSSESEFASQSPRRASSSIDRPIQFQSVQSPNHAIHALTSAAQPQPEKSYSDSLYINQLLQEKDSQISASVAKELQLSGQVARLTSEVESMKILLAQSNEQHNRDTANQLTSHSAALQTLQQSHFQELHSLQQRNASALAGREAQLNAIEDARQQSAAAAAAALEQDRQRLKHELVSERDRFQHELEVDRQRMIAELAATEQALQAEKDLFQREQDRIVQEREEAFDLRDKALHEKEHNLSELVAESQRVCEQKEQELSESFQQKEQQSLEELQRREESLQQHFQLKEESLQQHFQLKEQELYESIHAKELQLLDSAAERDNQFHVKRQTFEEGEHEFYQHMSSKRQTLQREYEENERSLFDKYKSMETSLQQSFQERLDALENERRSILDAYVERQKNIDLGNESKLKAIVNQYKERVKELEKAMEEAAIGNMRANDSAILAATESNRQRVEFEGVINSYKVLVEEQGQQMQLLRKENEALSSELSSIKVTYELLIGRLGDAQTIKTQMLAAEGETARYDASIKEQALHSAQDELEQNRSQLLHLQQTHASLQIDHARLLAALTVAADSKALAESETERMKMESKRVAKEMERLEKIVYGHSNTNRIATAAAVQSSVAPKKGSLHSTTSSKSTRTVTVTSTMTGNPSPSAGTNTAAPFMPQSLPYVPSVPSASIHASSIGAIAGSPLPNSSSTHLASSPTVQHSFLHSSSNEPLDVNFASALAHGSTPMSGPMSRNHLQ